MDNKKIADLVFVGLNSQVVALDRDSGEIIWRWKARAGIGFPALLVDGDRLVVSVQGYTYCLDPMTGLLVWENQLEGFGVGIPSVASVRGATSGQSGPAQAQTDQQAAAS